MKQFITDSSIKNGNLRIKSIPFSDDTEVKVIVIPKQDFSKLSFTKVRKMSRSIKGNLSDDVRYERKR